MTTSAEHTVACQTVDEKLLDYLYEELAEAERQALEAHIGGCSRCQAEVGSFGRVRQAARSVPMVEPPQALSAKILFQAAQHAPKQGKVLQFARKVWRHPAYAMAAGFVLIAGLVSYQVGTGKMESAPYPLPIAEKAAPTATAPAAPAPPAAMPAGEGAAQWDDRSAAAQVQAGQAGKDTQPTERKYDVATRELTKGKRAAAELADEDFLDAPKEKAGKLQKVAYPPAKQPSSDPAPSFGAAAAVQAKSEAMPRAQLADKEGEARSSVSSGRGDKPRPVAPSAPLEVVDRRERPLAESQNEQLALSTLPPPPPDGRNAPAPRAPATAEPAPPPTAAPTTSVAQKALPSGGDMNNRVWSQQSQQGATRRYNSSVGNSAGAAGYGLQNNDTGGSNALEIARDESARNLGRNSHCEEIEQALTKNRKLTPREKLASARDLRRCGRLDRARELLAQVAAEAPELRDEVQAEQYQINDQLAAQQQYRQQAAPPRAAPARSAAKKARAAEPTQNAAPAADAY